MKITHQVKIIHVPTDRVLFITYTESGEEAASIIDFLEKIDGDYLTLDSPQDMPDLEYPEKPTFMKKGEKIHIRKNVLDNCVLTAYEL